MSKHKELIEMMSNLEKAEIPYAIASVFSVQGSSSGKIGDKALFNEKGKRIICLLYTSPSPRDRG